MADTGWLDQMFDQRRRVPPAALSRVAFVAGRARHEIVSMCGVVGLGMLLATHLIVDVVGFLT